MCHWRNREAIHRVEFNLGCSTAVAMAVLVEWILWWSWNHFQETFGKTTSPSCVTWIRGWKPHNSLHFSFLFLFFPPIFLLFSFSFFLFFIPLFPFLSPPQAWPYPDALSIQSSPAGPHLTDPTWSSPADRPPALLLRASQPPPALSFSFPQPRAPRPHHHLHRRCYISRGPLLACALRRQPLLYQCCQQRRRGQGWCPSSTPSLFVAPLLDPPASLLYPVVHCTYRPPVGPPEGKVEKSGVELRGSGQSCVFSASPWLNRARERVLCPAPAPKMFFWHSSSKNSLRNCCESYTKGPSLYAWHAEVVCNHLYAYRWCFVIIACMHTWSGINYNHDACMPRCVFIIYLLLMSYLLVLFIFNYSFIFIFPFFLSILFIYFICSWFSLFLLLFSRNSSLSLIYF